MAKQILYRPGKDIIKYFFDKPLEVIEVDYVEGGEIPEGWYSNPCDIPESAWDVKPAKQVKAAKS